MRHHGWELPYHPLQVVAIAVFLALGFAFYVFFAPFLGNKVSELHFLILYSPLELAALVLYIRCAAANSADPGLLRACRSLDRKRTISVGQLRTEENDRSKDLEQGEEADITQQTLGESAHGSVNTIWQASWFLLKSSVCPGGLGGNLCGASVQLTERATPEEDLLFCTLCNVEVYKYSKHCRACNKCVDGFDHHCRWLNNCVGRKNYKTFIALMVTAFLMLSVQWIVGVVVLLRCFIHWKAFDDEVSRNLGSSFSMVPFVIIVGICTSLAMIATVPLGQLFLFHMILIKKGISTYDYIVTIRDEARAQSVDNGLSQLSSPSASSTVGGSGFLGTLQSGVSCTPPQLFEDQGSIIPSSVEITRSGFDSPIHVATKPPSKYQASVKVKQPVKISPWKSVQTKRLDSSKTEVRSPNLSILHHTERESISRGGSAMVQREELHQDRGQKAPLFKASTDNLDSGLWKHSQLGAGFINHPEFSVIHGGPQATLGPDVSLNRRSSMGFLCSDTLVDAVPRGSSHVKQAGTSSPTFSGDGLQSSKSDGYEVSREETTESSEHVSPMGTDWSLLQGQKREQ